MIKSLNAVTTPTVGTVLSSPSPPRRMTMWVINTGNPNLMQVDLEGSPDNIAWFTMGTTFQSGEVTTYPDLPYARANLKNLSGGINPTVTAWITSGVA